MQTKKWLSCSIIAALALGSFTLTALAAPTISSADRQVFDQNDISKQLRDITVTEDATTPLITAGELKIKIPEDIEIIFNQSLTLENLQVYGTAIDNGKVASTPEISFADKDKSLIIPILADFEAGDQLVIVKAYVKGFHSQPDGSKNLIMQINDGTEQYLDNETIYVRTSTNEDNAEPGAPINLVLADDPEGVRLTWTDPTDLDTNVIQVLRGKDPLPIDGTPFKEIAAGIEELVDTDVEEGDTIRYILRASDGPNFGENSIEISHVVGSTVPPEEPPPVDDPEEPVEDIETPPEEPVEPPVEPDPVPELTYEEEKQLVIDNGVVSQDFDKATNKCEAVIMLSRVAKWEVDMSVTDDGFSDTPDWCKPYAAYAKSEGIVKGRSTTEFGVVGEVTRYEIAVMLVRYLSVSQEKLDTAATHPAPYQDEIVSWANLAVLWLNSTEILTGFADGKFKGDQPMLKIELAVALGRL